ncbi:hypothetical protein PG994_005346 [Apiospora phragmitis]|uniref:Ecp2 effector protein-like domain-containing protein n=1 Tax=Apiospora phragmitis TaxID=2905665 RepID=A0ABR1VC06_9PEZI
MRFQPTSAGVADSESTSSASLPVRWSQQDLMGEQICPKCNRKRMTNFCDGSKFLKGLHVVDGLPERDQPKGALSLSRRNADASKYNAVKASEPGNCFFALKTKDGDTTRGSAALAMGSGDVFEIIRDSIAKFGENGKVLAHGETFCRGNEADERWGDLWVD